MSSIVKQSSLGLIANYVGILLGAINVLLIMPALLEAEQIGLINLILSVIMLIYPILSFSSSHILKRYFTHVDDRQVIFNYSFLISCVGALIFLVIFFFGEPIFIKYYKSNSSEILPYFWWIYIVSIMMSWTDLAVNYAIIHHRYHISAFSREILFRVGITILLLGLFLQLFDFNTYIYLHFIMYGLTGLIVLLILRSQGLFHFNFSLPKFSTSLNMKVFKFGSFTLFTGLASVLAIRIDMIMLGSMQGLKDVGIYTIAMYMATVIEVPRRTVIQASEPIIRVAIKENDLDKVAQIHYKSILNLLLTGGFILVMLIANLDAIYTLIPNGEIYEKGFWVVLFIGLAKISEMFGGCIHEIINASKYYVINIVFILLLTILSIGLNYYFIPIYGLVGAAAAAFFTTALVVLIKTITFKILFKKKIYSWAIFFTILFYAVLGTALYFIPHTDNSVLAIFTKGIIGSVALYSFLRWTKISPNLNLLINEILTKLKTPDWLKL